MKVDLYSHEIPEIFTDFKSIIGEKYWLNRVKRVKEDIRGHRYLEEYLKEENAIAFAMSRYSKLFRQSTKPAIHDLEYESLLPAIRFASQILSIMEKSSDKQVKALTRRIHGGFKKPNDLKAMELELAAATHFIRRGYEISWPEMEGTGVFDLLVKEIGLSNLEVECKLITRDKGRKIHHREAQELFHNIQNKFMALSKGLNTGLSVVLTMPNRLPNKIQQKHEILKRVYEQIILAESKSFDDGYDVRISEFDLSVLGDYSFMKDDNIRRNIADSVTGTSNREIMICGNINGGCIVFVIQSMQDDTFLDSIFNTLDNSAKKQFSSTRPAMFCVAIDSLGEAELRSLASEERDLQKPHSALQIKSSEFLGNNNRNHIVCLSFLSKDSQLPNFNHQMLSGGSTYYFNNKESNFWHDDFKNIFTPA